MALIARLAAHTQQICGLAWSPDNETFTTGGNDNTAYIFSTKKVLNPDKRRTTNRSDNSAVTVRRVAPSNEQSQTMPTPAPSLPASTASHAIALNAAIKALAYAPWTPSLLALGAGSNDRGIHFHHTVSGSKLATIDCSAQVTSLV